MLPSLAPVPMPAAPRAPRPMLNKAQKDQAIEAVWRSYWPFACATCIAVPMFIFGLAVAGLEAANLELGENYGASETGASVIKLQQQMGKLRIAVGVWSGAVILVAAVAICIINCANHVKHWVEAALGLVVSSAVFSAVNFSINARVVAAGAEMGGFQSNDSTVYRLAAAQIPAASLSFVACLAFLLLFLIVYFCKVRPLTNSYEPKEVPL